MQVLFLFSLCHCVDLSPRHGSVSLAVGDTTVFFKRESTGLNYDVVNLSPTPKLEGPRGATTDYVDPEYSAGTLFYRVEGRELHLFTAGTLHEPKTGTFPVRVVVHQLAPLEFADLMKQPGRHGATLLEIPLE